MNLLANKNLLIFAMLGVIVFLLMTKMNSCSGNNFDKKRYEQNMEAMKKKIEVTENRNKELQYNIVAYQGKAGELEQYSAELKKEVDALKGRKPKVIIRTQIQYVGDTVEVPTGVTDLGNGNYELPWSYASTDSSRVLEGKSAFKAVIDTSVMSLKIDPGKTTISKDELRLDFTVGVATNKKTGFDEIFITPKNANVHVGKLEGAILDKKKDKRFSIGPSVGFGVVYTQGAIGLGPYVGFSLNYSLLKF